MMPSPSQCLSDYSFRILFSIFLHMNCTLLPSSFFLSISNLSFSSFFFLISLSLSVSLCLPYWVHILQDGYLSSSVWQKRTISSICLFALLTHSCYKIQPGKSPWAAIRDTVHIFDINYWFLYFFFYLISWFFPPHSPNSMLILPHTQDCTNDNPHCLN